VCNEQGYPISRSILIDISIGPPHEHRSIRTSTSTLGMHEVGAMVNGSFSQVHHRNNKNRFHGTAMLIDQLRDGFASYIDFGGVGRGWEGTSRRPQRMPASTPRSKWRPESGQRSCARSRSVRIPARLGWRLAIGRKGLPATHFVDTTCCNWMSL
jgi:hypothetical protein